MRCPSLTAPQPLRPSKETQPQELAMSESVHLSSSGRIRAALLLTSIGGFVDAIGWLTLLQVFTANMSGNSIHVGMALGKLDFATLHRFICAISAYVLAFVLTRMVLEISVRSGVRRIASWLFLAEAALLVGFARIAPPLHDGHVPDQTSPWYFGMVAMLAFAMGVQTATLTHLGPLTVYTTFVTGTLTKFAESFTRLIFWIHDTGRNRGRMAETMREILRHEDALASAFLLGIWVAYVLGAALGTAAKAAWGLRAIYAPVVALSCLILVDLGQPIASKEELQQAAGAPKPTTPC